MKKIVYADNAATTALSPRALEAMMPYLKGEYGNPSSIYSLGKQAKKALAESREKIAVILGAAPEEIYFTSGGSEADNWAIKGAAQLKKAKGRHIISSAIEHPAVLNALKSLAKEGYEITFLPVNSAGEISLKELEAAIREDTILISIMAANNEIGTLQPIKEIGEIAKKHQILFHTDAVQVIGHMPFNVAEQHINMLALAGHKFCGPKGVGALYIKKGLRLPSYIHGGEQERGRRAGTENVAGMVGMAAALEESAQNMEKNLRHTTALRDKLIEGLLQLPYTRLTGHPEKRLPGIASFVFEAVEGESMILLLDQQGICASSGSACSSGSLDPSHVLLSIGLPHESAHGSLRLSLNENNTEEDVAHILNTLPGIINRLREMSPLWEDKMAGN